jgi:hypothetical protein
VSVQSLVRETTRLKDEQEIIRLYLNLKPNDANQLRKSNESIVVHIEHSELEVQDVFRGTTRNDGSVKKPLVRLNFTIVVRTSW